MHNQKIVCIFGHKLLTKGIGQPSRKIMSRRIALTDDSGRWFSLETAEQFDEKNCISKATGSQRYHECLYRTAGGLFILNTYPDSQGTPETYVIISKEEAAIWFSKNNYDPHKDIEKEFSELEIK